MHTPLRGLKFRPVEVQSFAQGLPAGQRLTLVREPSNAYDPHAIKVIAEGRHIGYVAAEVAKDLAPMIDSGAEIAAEVITSQPFIMDLGEADD